MGSYTTFDVCRILSIQRNLLAQWLRNGYVQPSISEARGLGTKNLFSQNDLFVICLFHQMVDSGISRQYAGIYSNIDFSDVSGRPEGYKFMILKRKMRKNTRQSPVVTDLRLEANPPRIDFADDDSYATVFNLIGIKKKMEHLLSG
jgi:hypothetical protein